MVLCLICSLFTFVIFYVVPRQGNTQLTRGRLDTTRTQQFSGPVVVQYWQWVSGVAHGSLGHSYVSRRPVAKIVRDALPVTLALTIGGAILWLLIALPLGVLSALRPRSFLDRTATVVVLIGISIHPLWLGLFLSYLFGYRLHALPFTGYCDMFSPVGSCGGPAQWFTHMLMPWITFALVFAAIYVRMIRATVTETLEEDYVRFARAKGMSEWAVLRRHCLPNAFIPVVPMVAMDISRFALPTALFVETAFGLPGLGRVLRDALLRNDLPVIVGVVVVSVLVIVIVNFLGEIVQAFIDPAREAAGGPGSGLEDSRRRPSRSGRGRAPTTVARASPPANRITVGSESTPWSNAVCGCSSMFIVTNPTPGCSASSSSSTRPTAAHGPHQGAQKSTTTGRPAPSTSSAKLASVISSIRLA